MLRVVTDEDARAEMPSSLDEIVLDGARRMLAAALQAEVDTYVAGLAGERDESGRRLVQLPAHLGTSTASNPGWLTPGGDRAAANELAAVLDS